MIKRRLAALLLALVAVLGVSVSAPQPARADGPISNVIEGGCRAVTGPLLGIVTGGGQVPGQPGSITGSNLCDAVGKAGEKAMKKAWKNVWDSVLGDVIRAAQDVTKWVIKKVLTVALLGPSLDLEATGLFGKDATLAGMLTWLGLVIAAFGAMWQIGKMAVTGQSKHIGRAMLGWVENTILSAVGVGLIALLVSAGDALSTGLVNAVFEDDGRAYERITAVMVPVGVHNPITMLCIVAVLLLIGFIQLVMVFLRQSAIPIQCLLLPVAGGGRVGGDVTRQWAPRLITSICVVIAYKPILAVIICTGFAEFGHAKTLAEWLRGCATLVLAILAPGPLAKLFAPFGEAVGGGLAAGGASGAVGALAGYLGKGAKGGDGGDGRDGGGARPATPMEHAQYVEQSMGRQSGQSGGSGSRAGGDAQLQAARNDANRRMPGQAAPGEGAAAGAKAGAAGTGTSGTQTAGAAAGTAGAAASGAGAAAAGAGIAIQVLDGVNNAVQGASGQIGNGGNTQ
ncbi:hypothetical protein ACIBAI_22610 [Streptomyces sp. NPDC051041]|uniref:hypothetical protein n=1 Tax=Streptomyces sp. NPDC051041 TaxID=3365640 RepID=UPI00378EA6AE